MIIHLNILFVALRIYFYIVPVSAAIYYTPYVDLCDYATARNVSQPLTKLFGKNQVHAGYFTVNRKSDVNLFSLYVKSVNSSENTPLIVWIQGHPEITALYAVFGQNGPYMLENKFNLTERRHAWTNYYDVLYLDSIIFTGYSYSKDYSNMLGYLQDIDRHLYEALHQFYQIFPEASSKQLYLAGEFFCGKYLLMLAHHIHTRNPLSHIKMNLTGLYIGGGFTDPVHMMDYASLFYQIGIIDFDKWKNLDNLQRAIIKGILSKRYDTARQQIDSIWVELLNSGYQSAMDFTKMDNDFDADVIDFLQRDVFRNAFGLTKSQFHYLNSTSVFLESRNYTIELIDLLREDILKSAVDLLPTLLDHYRVLFYGAQFDLRVPYVHVANFIRKLKWKGAFDYYNTAISPRNHWYVDNEMAGYWKCVHNLTEVMVRNSGHMIDVSQPKWSINLLTSFISNKFKPLVQKEQGNTPPLRLATTTSSHQITGPQKN